MSMVGLPCASGVVRGRPARAAPPPRRHARPQPPAILLVPLRPRALECEPSALDAIDSSAGDWGRIPSSNHSSVPVGSKPRASDHVGAARHAHDHGVDDPRRLGAQGEGPEVAEVTRARHLARAVITRPDRRPRRAKLGCSKRGHSTQRRAGVSVDSEPNSHPVRPMRPGGGSAGGVGGAFAGVFVARSCFRALL